jgi:hypothetical protein
VTQTKRVELLRLAVAFDNTRAAILMWVNPGWKLRRGAGMFASTYRNIMAEIASAEKTKRARKKQDRLTLALIDAEFEGE